MRLYNGKIILTGLLVFTVLVTIPLWKNLGKSPAAPTLSLDTPQIQALAEKRCVEPTAYMRASHMSLIEDWKNAVVRDGYRVYLSSAGKEVPMSLSQTCLGCHSNKEKFCDRCHDYTGVRPNCWSCHVVPKEKS